MRALCVVRDSGRVECVRIEDLRRILSDDFMDKLNELIRDMLEEAGLGTGQNALFSCRGQWRTASLDLPSTARPTTRSIVGAARGKTVPSPAEAQSMLNQCRQAVRAELEVSLQAGGMGRAEMVRETVG